ncbi:MAG: anthranilate synthase component I [Halodesulfurarchaeum sp.]
MSLDMDRSTFLEKAAGDEPVVLRVAATLDVEVDPLEAYAILAEATPYSFLLESGEKTSASDPDGAFQPSGTAPGRHARYSFLGYDPAAVVTVDEDGARIEELERGAPHLSVDATEGDVLDTLREAFPDHDRRGFQAANRQVLEGGLVGFLAYDAVYDLWLSEVGVERPPSPVPDAQFVFATRTLVFDHKEETLQLVLTPILEPGAEGQQTDHGETYDRLQREAARVERELAEGRTPTFEGFAIDHTTAGSREAYEAAVTRAKEAVADGEVYQAVISRTKELHGSIDPLALYSALRQENPSPYMYLLRFGDRTVAGASPETLVSVNGDTVLNNPIAGTCPRGESPVEDRRLSGEMLADEKERAEHTMLVDLARNDVRRVAEPGSVRVPEFMRVLKYSQVQHIESTVTGTLREDADAFDAVRASFPAGTLSGAPKVRAMELIDELEAEPRGIYGGGVGYISWTGDAAFAIVIRTATIEHGGDEGGDDTVRVRAGAGIVADSEPASEFDETEAKMEGVLDAIERIADAPEPGKGEGSATGRDGAGQVTSLERTANRGLSRGEAGRSDR